MLLLRTLIFTLLAPGSVTVWAPWLLLTSGLPRLPIEIGPARWLGLAPIVLGAAGYVWCAWDFAAAGRGTPAP